MSETVDQAPTGRAGTMANPFFTIGHSNRPREEFVGLLQSAGIARVADVRSIPRSRSNPQYNIDALPAALSDAGIGYEHIAALGGRRARQPGVAAESNAFWENRSFHNYADYAMGEDFRRGLERLRELGRRERCAIMCAEAVWWRCHRRIIADHLIAAGETVFHILDFGQVKPAQMTGAARLSPGGTVTYPG